MDFPFFTEDEQPTMANFNEKFRALVNNDINALTGTYVGTGSQQSIVIGFPPKLVIVCHTGTVPYGNNTMNTIGILAGPYPYTKRLQLLGSGGFQINSDGPIPTEDGFTVSGYLSAADVNYGYVAIG